MEKYGTDKPDLRSDKEIIDLTDVGSRLGSELIKKTLASGGVLKGLVVGKGGAFSRSQLDKLSQKAAELGAKGLIWLKKQDGFKSSLKLDEKELGLIWKNTGAADDDLVLIVAGAKPVSLNVLGELRRGFILEQKEKKDILKYAWITDFPLFEWSDGEKRLVSMHHPFTSPHEEDLNFLEKDSLRVRAKAYDLVLNGVEIGGGSTRIHDPKLQERIFKVLGLNDKEVEAKFGFLLEALQYGTPPHGGIALGFDRIVMILAGEESIRDVIPFPKTTSALCLLTGSPSEVDPRQLEELGLKKTKP
jgi:aspartyl-tRNA synthetase